MRTDPDCIFCKIVAGDIPCFKLFEDNHTLAFMDINPANSGHVLAVPKEHWEDVYAVPDSLIATTVQTAKRIAQAINKALHPHGINLVQANGPGAAQSVFHFHIHILPRERDDELKLNWGPKPGDIADIEASFEKIKAQLT
jgi:histidine triad (HIT) family protein